MSVLLATGLLAVATALACCLPGVFLVLRRQAMLTDAMGHAALPGIVIAAMIVGSIDSPLLILGAAAMGLVVVAGAQYLRSTGLLAGDADQGLIFPALFSIGVILISTRFAQVHLHEDAVLVGDLNYAAFLELKFGGYSLGPRYFWVMLAVAALNAFLLWLFFRPLKIATFDPALAQVFGLRAKRVHYAFMFVVSVTIVAAFNAAGAILVVALMIVPAATALLLARTPPALVFWTVVIALVTAILGFLLAYVGDFATSPMMALVDGLVFLLIWAGKAVVGTSRQAVAS